MDNTFYTTLFWTLTLFEIFVIIFIAKEIVYAYLNKDYHAFIFKNIRISIIIYALIISVIIGLIISYNIIHLPKH